VYVPEAVRRGRRSDRECLRGGTQFGHDERPDHDLTFSNQATDTRGSHRRVRCAVAHHSHCEDTQRSADAVHPETPDDESQGSSDGCAAGEHHARLRGRGSRSPLSRRIVPSHAEIRVRNARRAGLATEHALRGRTLIKDGVNSCGSGRRNSRSRQRAIWARYSRTCPWWRSASLTRCRNDR
jgi:hypothetical protein